MRLFSALLVLISFSSSADWQLDASNSTLNFISTKNTDFSEMHSFDTFSGAISGSGKLTVDVNLASVNTMIEIRNTRMRDMLFNVGEYATASFSAQLPESVMNAQVGSHQTLALTGQLSLHGVSSPVTAHIRVIKLDDDTYSAHTVKPIILSATQFGLEAGVAALQKIAGLTNISMAVPVSFSVVFKR